jgi:hypothetical protein
MMLPTMPTAFWPRGAEVLPLFAYQPVDDTIIMRLKAIEALCANQCARACLCAAQPERQFACHGTNCL